MLSTDQAVTLTRRYQRQLQLVGDKTSAIMARIWDSLGSWDERDIDPFTHAATPVLTGAHQQASALTLGYLGLLLGSSLTIEPLAVDIDARSPFLGYWAALNRGDKWTEAITTGRSRAEDLALDGTTTAARDTASAVDPTEDRITGWERVPGGICCEFCATVATQRYHTAESAAFGHSRCNCAVVPIIGKTAPGRVINRPLLEQLRSIPADQRTGYVTATGAPAARPEPAAVAAP